MAQMLKHLDASEPVRFLIAECETAVHAADRPLLRQAVRGRRPDRHLAPVRDPQGARARRRDHRRGAGGPGLSRLPARPRPDLHPDRLLGRRPLHRPARRRGRDRAHPAPAWPTCCARTASPSSSSSSSTPTARASAAAPIPSSFADRLRYYDTAESRRRFAAAGIALAAGEQLPGRRRLRLLPDRRTSALAVVTRILEHALASRRARPTTRSTRTRTMSTSSSPPSQQFNKAVIDDPCYAALARRLRRQPALPDRLALAAAPVRRRPARNRRSSTPRSSARSRTTASCSSSACWPTRSAASARRSTRTPSSPSGSTARARASAA